MGDTLTTPTLSHTLSIRNGWGQAFIVRTHGTAQRIGRLATTLQSLGFMVALTTDSPRDRMLPPSGVLALVRSCLHNKGRGFAAAMRRF
jgi:hypothetical protein